LTLAEALILLVKGVKVRILEQYLNWIEKKLREMINRSNISFLMIGEFNE